MRCYAFFLAFRTHTFAFLPVLPFPCWAACHGREVRRHVILQWCVERIQPGRPQAPDDNQPKLSRRFSTAWKIHGPICQTWNGLLHCLEFPRVSSDRFTECHTVAAVTGSDSFLLLIPSPPLFACSFNASYSSYCMLIRGTWSDRGSSTARQLSVIIWKAAVLEILPVS